MDLRVLLEVYEKQVWGTETYGRLRQVLCHNMKRVLIEDRSLSASVGIRLVMRYIGTVSCLSSRLMVAGTRFATGFHTQ